MPTHENTLSDLALARIVEITEAAAYADLLHAAPSEWRCVAEETDGGWLLAAPETVNTWLAEWDLVPRDRWTKVYRAADAVTDAETNLRIDRQTGEDTAARPNPSFRNMIRRGIRGGLSPTEFHVTEDVVRARSRHAESPRVGFYASARDELGRPHHVEPAPVSFSSGRDRGDVRARAANIRSTAGRV